MRTIRAWAAIAAAASVMAGSSGAAAYCLTTTCDPNSEDCGIDAAECATKGLRLYWPVACTSYNLEASATPGIGFDAFSEAAAASFAAWTAVDCGGGDRPSVQVMDLGPIETAATCYNQKNGNSNVVFFQSETWPYAGGKETIALTTVTFNTQTGEIYDADLEINAAVMSFSVSDTVVENDLQSVITHEAGHFFGLAHAGAAENMSSTMYEKYAKSSTALRTLEADDAAGMCALYPPGRSVGKCDPTPRHGFGAACGDAPQDEGGCSTRAGGKAGRRVVAADRVGDRGLPPIPHSSSSPTESSAAARSSLIGAPQRSHTAVFDDSGASQEQC